jgi:hypothetical protein
MSGLPICCVTGRIAGDLNACGDCDPCILGAPLVPEVVKRLIAERDEWADKYAGAMMDADAHAALVAERDALRKALEWQTMETAPRDGTDILACWDAPTDMYRARGVVRWEVFNLSGDGYWATRPGDWNKNPTHWQPLPEPPSPSHVEGK